MGQVRLRAPRLGTVWASALAVLVGVSLCAAQALEQPESVLPADELPPPGESVDELLDMDLDQLSRADVVVPAMDTVVSSVSRQESTVGRSPAAVFVITPEMIRRSGANNIPDVLRMVPGVEVARIDANKWAISIRGFNSRFSGKILVQIDGRCVYNQQFSGVYWDAQDVVLEDIERIEVIRGPGATVWGANAVNGIINIITKQAKDTQGALVTGGTGTEERGFGTVRYGGQVGDDLHWRVYGKQFERDGGYSPDGEFDDWRQGRGGFRSDWCISECDTITALGDYYDGASGALTPFSLPTAPFAGAAAFDDQIRGQDYLLRWTHVLDEDSDWTWQVYYDQFDRDGAIDSGQKTFDLDFQYRFPWEERHNIICGAGYRHVDDYFFGTFSASWRPMRRNTDLFNYFIQDEITLEEDRWYLTAGSKFEHNDFTGFEMQPSVRLLFLPSERESLWAAVSRAVRTPGRAEDDIFLHSFVAPGPTFVEIAGDPSVVSEELIAYEMGYRAQPTDEFSWDLAVFYNDYDNLFTTIPGGAPFFDPGIGAVIIPVTFANALSADTYGAELASTYRINCRWELSGAYTLFYADFHGPTGSANQDLSPHNRVYLRSSWDLGNHWEFDLIGRYVDNIPEIAVSSYLTMDIRLAWKPYKNFEWSVVGRNLFDGRHAEFVDNLAQTVDTEVQPEVFTTLTWTY